jgi:hypothetical protein
LGLAGLDKNAEGRATADRMAARLGGTSLSIVGLMMLSLVFVEMRWAGTMLALTGGVLVLRGLFIVGLSLRME